LPILTFGFTLPKGATDYERCNDCEIEKGDRQIH
jgi:hypothetical protein